MKLSLIRRLTPALALMLAAGGAMAQAASAPDNVASGTMGKHTKEPHKDASFMKDAAEAGMAEVQAAQIAQKQSQNDQVKAFATQMEQDHTKANDELKALADSKGVKLPTSPSMTDKAKLKMLGGHNKDFDKDYSEGFGVKAHEKAVKLFQKEAKDGKDADAKAWAEKTLPTLQHHLEMARDLEKATGGTKK
jgi:putative membrane protein